MFFLEQFDRRYVLKEIARGRRIYFAIMLIHIGQIRPAAAPRLDGASDCVTGAVGSCKAWRA